MSPCPAHVKPMFSVEQQQHLDRQFPSGQQYVLVSKLLHCQQLLAHAQCFATSLAMASDSTMHLDTLLPFQKHVGVSPLLSNEADLTNAQLFTADDVQDDDDSDLADFDLVMSMIMQTALSKHTCCRHHIRLTDSIALHCVWRTPVAECFLPCHWVLMMW